MAESKNVWLKFKNNLVFKNYIFLLVITGLNSCYIIACVYVQKKIIKKNIIREINQSYTYFT
jgi:hypothetical protein